MPRDDNVWAQVSRYTGLALLLPISTAVGYVIGRLLDRLLHTHFLYLVFLLIGIVAGFISLFRELTTQLGRDGS